MRREFDVDGNNHDTPLGSNERDYLQKIGRIPLLTAEEEILLSMQIHRGLKLVRPTIRAHGYQVQTLAGCDPTTYPSEEAQILEQAMAAKRHMTETNLRLVVSIAKRYPGRGMDFLDLVQEGNIGLMHAAEKFDPERGNRFSTYSTWWVRQAVTRAIADQARIIRLPVHMVEAGGKVDHARISLQQRLQIEEPPIEAIVGQLEDRFTAEKVAAIQRYVLPTISLDRPMPDSSHTWADDIEDWSEPPPDSVAEQSVLKDAISQVLQSLTDRQRLVLEMHFGLGGGRPHTLEQIGKQLGVTRERIRQIEEETLRRLRHPSRSKKLKDYYEQ